MPVPRRFDRRPPERDTTRINERIRVPEVRLIDDQGQQIGVLKTPDALTFAQERDLDLVEVAPEARPPVCRVLDYSKYKYEQAQKVKQARKHQQQITVREIKFRPKIAEHDYDTKKHHVERFLRHKDKVKVTIMFRGREVTHPERGTAILDRLAEELSELGVVEQRPMQEGRNMTMMMAPSKAVLAGKASVGPAADEVFPVGEVGDVAAEALESPLEGGDQSTPVAEPAPADPPGAAAADGGTGRRRQMCRTRLPAPPCHNHRLERGAAGCRPTSRVPQSSIPYAQDEDPLRREEALQSHRHRQGARPACLHEPHPREEVAQTQAPAGYACAALERRRPARQAAAGSGQMTRVKRSVGARKKRRATLALTKGFRGEAHSNYRRAKEALLKADAYAYRDRRNRKRDFRRLWITRINAAARVNGMSYSQFMHGLSLAGVELDRKVLADIAVRDADTFRRFADTAREASAA